MDIFGKNDAVRNRMLADATHRMKNLLGGIGGFAGLLQKDIEDNDPRMQLVERIKESVIRLDEFIVDFMVLLKDQSLNIENLDLPTLLREACNQHFQTDEETLSECPLKPECFPAKIQIKADPVQLRRCLYHAVRFLALVSTEYGDVRAEFKGKEDIHVLFEFQSDYKLKPLLKNPIVHIDEIESIDARISFLLCLKMSQYHHGQAQLEQKADDAWVLHLYLRKDFEK